MLIARQLCTWLACLEEIQQLSGQFGGTPIWSMPEEDQMRLTRRCWGHTVGERLWGAERDSSDRQLKTVGHKSAGKAAGWGIVMVKIVTQQPIRDKLWVTRPFRRLIPPWTCEGSSQWYLLLFVGRQAWAVDDSGGRGRWGVSGGE